MRTCLITKTVVLFSFISLITLFVAYRSGCFDGYYINQIGVSQISHNGGPIAKAPVDTVPEDLQRSILLSSSKSIVLTDGIRKQTDSIVLTEKVKRNPDSILNAGKIRKDTPQKAKP